MKKEIRNEQEKCTYFESVKKDNKCKHKFFAGSHLDERVIVNIWNCDLGGGVELRCSYYWEVKRIFD